MSIKDILKISKAEITFLVVIVSLSGFLAAPGAISHILRVIPLVVAGSMASMSAAIFNNIYDRDIDVRMKRTSSRRYPLEGKGVRFFFAASTAMIAVSMAIGLLFINPLSTVFILMGFLSYVFLYTMFLKRRTSWNIVIGGIAGSFPAMAGWAAVTGGVSYTALFIALLVFMWTPTHFWSLAIGLKEDYQSAGIPMLPAKVGEDRASSFIIINTVILVAYSMLPLVFHQIAVGHVYIIIAVIMDVVMMALVLKAFFELPERGGFRNAFHFSNLYLLVLLIAMWLVVI
ncbi:MAG: heme o synthase [Candidatus Thermoplasmatota archaeon]|nr:heme o synthase [Candidatus Thermoplasmatota archaeon]